MARNDNPATAAMAGNVRAGEWIVVAIIWLLVQLLAAEPWVEHFEALGLPLTIFAARVAMTADWALWMMLIHPAFKLFDWAMLRPNWMARAALLVASGMLAGAVHGALCWPVYRALGLLLPIDPRILASNDLQLLRLIVEDLYAAALPLTPYLVLLGIHRGRRRRELQSLQEKLLTEARLHALSLELQPHFLFNTLNSIAATMRSDPRTAERMLVLLADLLRTTLDAQAAQVPLRDELRRLDLYVELQQLRFGPRLDVRIDVPAALKEAMVPAMILQPLVENSLQHGVGRKVGPARVEICARVLGTDLELLVRDDGVGYDPAAASSGGVGLRNTRERLQAMYPNRSSFSIEADAAGGAVARVCLPLVREATA